MINCFVKVTLNVLNLDILLKAEVIVYWALMQLTHFSVGFV